jgi:hypothetical protein
MHLPLLYVLTIRAAFAMLFGAALAHKLARWSSFEATLSQYLTGFGARGSSFATPVAMFVVAVEACVLVACSLPSTGPLAGALIAGAMLAYGTAMLINLARGNALLDCGCSWGKSRQPVSYALVARNGGLALLALLLALPIRARPLEPVEVVSALAAALMVAVLYAALNELLTNAKAIAGEVQ